MFILILGFGLAALAHGYLREYAPSNAVMARARVDPPRWRTVAVLALLACVTLVAVRLLETVLAAGAPGWFNLVVVVLAWDAIKFGLTAVSVAIRCSMPRRWLGHERCDERGSMIAVVNAWPSDETRKMRILPFLRMRSVSSRRAVMGVRRSQSRVLS